MRVLLCLLAVAACGFAVKDKMIESNRIPMEPAAALGDTCNECKSVVKRFIEAVDDPKKMDELKMLLRALCHETSYSEECQLFVSKLDVIIKKLEPWLRDYEQVCKKIHLCSNAKLTAFHRLGLLYAKQTIGKVDGQNDLVCEECQMAMHEFKKFVDDQKERKQIQQYISDNVCGLVAKYKGACDMMLDEVLPEFWNAVDAFLTNTKTACSKLGFCPKTITSSMSQGTSPRRTLTGFFKRGKYLAGPKGTILLSCFECKLAIDGIIDSLKTPEQEQKISNDLRDDACPALPANMYDGCIDFINMYGPTVVHMTVLQLNSEQICEDLKACDVQSIKNMRALSVAQKGAMKCDACKAFSAFLEYELTQPDLKEDVVAGVRKHICPKARALSPLCENVAETMLPKVLDVIVAKFAAQANFCKNTLHVC